MMIMGLDTIFYKLQFSWGSKTGHLLSAEFQQDFLDYT